MQTQHLRLTAVFFWRTNGFRPPLVSAQNLWRLMAQGFYVRQDVPSCHSADSVKALEETQSTYHSRRPGLVLASTTNGLLSVDAVEGTFHYTENRD